MLISKIKSFNFLSFLLYHLVFLAILVTNFPFDKFFIGWDALNPEFNFPVNFERSLFAGWQENYGLGALGGHGFAALFPHNIVTFCLSLLLPIGAIRSVFTFLCLYLGGIGFYFFIRLVLEEINKEKFSHGITEFVPLLASLFYLLNLGTIQIFYIQLEAFIVHFAALPWLFWIVIRVLKNINRKNLVLFLLINFFASIQGFIPSLFVTYSIALGILLFVYAFQENTFHSLKKICLIILLTFFVNAYWFLPFGYYQLARGGITLNAYNNLISTEDFILKNKKYGNIQNVALLKSFSFDMEELGGYVFQPWIQHQSNALIIFIGYSIFAFILLGLVRSFFSIFHWITRGFLFIFLYFFASLAMDTFPFSWLTALLGFLHPTYQQAFRTAFTKFGLGVAFSYSIFLGIGIFLLIASVHSSLKKTVVKILALLFLFIGLIYYSLPVFQGKLFYNKLLVKMPQAYFDLFDFFREKENGRIADFPQDCAEGWYGYGWGYFGSGFSWYALRQPVLARSFDVWSNYNENYYWEIVQAIKSRNYPKIDSLIEKYNVKWLVYDQNLIHCRTTRGFLNYDEFIQYLEGTAKYKLVKTFSSGLLLPIKIYENINYQANIFVRINENLPNIGPRYNWTSEDKAYSEYQNYKTDEKVTYDVFYPFRSLFTGRKQEDFEFRLEEKEDYFSFFTKVPKDFDGAHLIIPGVFRDEIAEIDEVDLTKSRELHPDIFLDGELIQTNLLVTSEATKTAELSTEIHLPYIENGNLEVRIPKVRGYYSYTTRYGNLFENHPTNCDQFSKGIAKNEPFHEGEKIFLRLTSINSSNCLDFDLPRLTQRLGYIISVQNRYREGKSFLFSVLNGNSQRADLETYLPKQSASDKSYFIIPPMESFAFGYTLHLDNISIGRVKTVNDLGFITVNSIPYRFLTSLKLVRRNPNPQPTTHNPQLITVEHSNPSFYQIAINKEQITNNTTTLILSQSYDKAWRAYHISCQDLNFSCRLKKLLPFLFFEELKDHVLVNNWENGWMLSGNKQQLTNDKENTIVIVYLPQYLEYFGFGLLLFVPFFFLIREKTREHPPYKSHLL